MIPMNQLPADVANLPPIVRDGDDLSMLSQMMDAPKDGKDDDDSPMNLQELDDGSVMILDDEEEQKDTQFDENLAEVLDSRDIDNLGSDLVEAIESDMRVREQRDKQYAEGIQRTGLGNEAPGGATFDGASRAVHPMLSKGCVDFASRAIKELFPANGPCKTQIVGDITDAKVDKAERKKQFMNWQLTTQVSENRGEFERLLSQLPLGGSQYKRWWWDAHLDRPRTEVVYIDDVFLPYNQSDFRSSPRITYRQYVTEQEFDNRIASGLYREIRIGAPPQGIEDKSKSRTATEKVEGSEEDSAAYNEAGMREVFQAEVLITCEGDTYADGPAPYIAHIDRYTKKVLGLYRNWKESDDRREKKHWMVEYNFIPWRGAYGIGLGHLIGSLAASGTGAVRAILDAAHIQNFPAAVKLKGGRQSGENVQVNAGEVQEISAPPNVDDIRKLIMPFPYSGPSSVLFQLLEWLTQQAESVVTTASERIAEGGGANMPVGTAMALIESDSANFSAIHARMHHSLKQEMEILHRLNAENLESEEVIEDLGELVVSPADFKGPVDIIPVSDPNIFSEAQRFAQMQAVLQIAENDAFKSFFKQDRLLARILKLIQVPDLDDIANLPKDATRLGALEENYTASAGPDVNRPLKVYEEQDDLGHLQIHIQYMTSPIFGANPLIGAVALPSLVNHCKDHLLALYRKHTAAASEAMQATAKAQGVQLTDEEAASHGAAFADATLAKALGPMILPGLQQAMQAAMQMAPKPPIDPSIQAQIDGQVKIATIRDQGDTTRKKAELDAEAQREQGDAAANAQASQLAAQMESQQTASQERLGVLEQNLEMWKNRENNETRVTLTELQGQQAMQLEQFKKYLDSIMPPDLAQQIQSIAQNSGQVSAGLAQELASLRQEVAERHQSIVDLLNGVATASKRRKP